MIKYLMIGTNDLEKARDFYDDLLTRIGGSRVFETETGAAWGFGEDTTLFAIVKPYDGNEATVGNGTMVALGAENPEAVDALHARALELGGTNEGDPGLRGKSFYGAYFRDLDGNKLNFYCNT